MTRPLIVLLVLTGVASGCSQPGPATAKLFTPKAFLAPADEVDFGGWAPKELAVASTELIPFSTERQRDGYGLPVRPGVSEGRALGFVITDIWEDHPEPWVQPVWHLATDASPPVPRGRPSIFPVDVDSTFYSPWWRQVLVAQPADEGDLHGAREVLTHRLVETPNLILCPLVPEGVSVARPEGAPVRHPLTRRELKAPPSGSGVVEGKPVSYLAFGAGLAPFEKQRLVEAELFVFTHAGKPVPVAAVLPPDALHHAYLARVEVRLPDDAKVFVPSNRSDLRVALGDLAPMVGPELDGFPEYALRVARSSACFTLPDFPAGCDWLDSQAKVRAALPASAFVSTHVEVTAPVLEEVMP